MIFSELACFSPSVDAEIRQLWVNNGGRLTHTDGDFRQAEFFFCNGMRDPWLEELLSRFLIVRHASWVTLCVYEQFRMPIAVYTLDERFDESKIKVIEPGLMFTRTEQHFDVGVGRKRPLDDAAAELQRPTKRAKIDPESSKKKLVQPVNTQKTLRQPLVSSLGITSIGHQSGQLERRSFVSSKPGSKTGKVSQTVKLFESRINQPKVVTLSPPLTPVSKGKNRDSRKDPTTPCTFTMLPRPSPLNRHTLFWNDLLARAESQVWETGTGNEVLTLKMDDLLRAPRLRVGIFKVNETFLGKKFINQAYP